MTFHEPGAGSQPVPPTSPQQTQTYSYPQQPYSPEQQQAPAPKRERNTLGLIALITSIVGFIFACIPGALIVGWILLPIAFILGLVSLFMKGKGKGLGIAGLILSVVGTIVAVVVFLSVVATSFDEAFGDESAIVEQPADSGDDAAEEAPAADAAAEGSRENPVALGSTISTDDWTVVVNSYTADGNPVVAANEFNDAAPAGSHYEIVNYTVTYTGADSAFVAGEIGVDVVTSAGNVVADYDNLVVLDDSMGLDELFTGASATGSAAFVVPDGETVQIRVRPGMFGDEVFVQP